MDDTRHTVMALDIRGFLWWADRPGSSSWTPALKLCLLQSQLHYNDDICAEVPCTLMHAT
jgi:hypothetical protein